MKEIALTRGFIALVDDEDYDLVRRYKWHAVITNKSTPYAKTGIFGRPHSHYMHRLIMDCRSEQIIDHINKNGLDNRRSNLRISDKSKNALNAKKRNGCSSRFKGVCWNSRDRIWMAYASLNGRRKYLSTHQQETDAAIAYDEWMRSNVPDYASLNFP